MNKLLGWWSDKDILIVDQIGVEIRGHKIWNTPGVLKLIYGYTDAAHWRMPTAEELEDIHNRENGVRMMAPFVRNPDPRWSHLYYHNCSPDCVMKIIETAFGGRERVLYLPRDRSRIVTTLDKLQQQGIRCIVSLSWSSQAYIQEKSMHWEENNSILHVVSHDTKDIALVNYTKDTACVFLYEECPITSCESRLSKIGMFVCALGFLIILHVILL
jgi:hypothetical protein